jgi:hypothetical protein
VRPTPSKALALAAALALALAGCGGSKAHSTTSGVSSGHAGAAPSAPPGSTSGSGQTTQPSETSSNQQGGGTEPVRAPAMLTGRGGRITPTSVAVPPYIAVEISLSCADSGPYHLSVAGKSLSVSPAHPNASVTLPGLRPGSSYIATSGSQKISITPSAEPGP